MLENAALGPPVPRDGTLLGALFESLVTLCVRVYAQGAEATTGHLRTFSGEREVDLIVEALDKRVVAIEVKLKRTVTDDDVRNLRWLQSKIGDEPLDAIVITTGESAYRRPDEIGVAPAAPVFGWACLNGGWLPVEAAVNDLVDARLPRRVRVALARSSASASSSTRSPKRSFAAAPAMATPRRQRAASRGQSPGPSARGQSRAPACGWWEPRQARTRSRACARR